MRHTRPTYRVRERSGYTLLELVVVMIILAILTSAIVPIFGESIKRLRRDGALDGLIASMKYAHERSIMDSVEYRFYMDDDKNCYWLESWQQEKKQDSDQGPGQTTALSATQDPGQAGGQAPQQNTSQKEREDQRKWSFKPVAEPLGQKQNLPDSMEMQPPIARKDKDRHAFYIAFYPGGACDVAEVKVRLEDSGQTVTISTKGRLGQFDVKGRDE